MPRADAAWLGEFAAGFAKLARIHDVALVGGDTTSPLITVQAPGHLPASKAMRLPGSSADILFRIEHPGRAAAAGLALEQGTLAVADSHQSSYLRERFLFPTPRVELGRRLRDHASACIDVSDGLLGDVENWP